MNLGITPLVLARAAAFTGALLLGPCAAQAPARPAALPAAPAVMQKFLPLPRVPPAQLAELVQDLAAYLEQGAGYRRLGLGEAAIPGQPATVTATVALARLVQGESELLAFGFIAAPRRLPQLWVTGWHERQGGRLPHPELAGGGFETALQAFMAERADILAQLPMNSLESRIITLSYADADAALFALRAMGYATVPDAEAPAGAEAGRPPEAVARRPMPDGSDPGKLRGDGPLPVAAGPAAPVAAARPAPARATPSTISFDRLPLIIKLPSTEPRNLGLVGGIDGNSASAAAAAAAVQRDNMGLTVMPSMASSLNETVAAGTSQLMVLFHPSYPEQFTKVRRTLQETVDRPARQVFIEGLVLEVSQEGLRELGVQWSAKKGSKELSLGSLTPLQAGDSAFSFLRDSALSLTPAHVLARINALVQSNKAEVLSRPSVITLDNRQATIRVGTDIPIATSKDAGTAAGSSRVAFSFQYIPTGILLNVRPRITEDNTEISMLIDATVSATVPNQDLQVLDPQTKISLASAPTISTRRVQTYARIRDNMPLIIGGLVSRTQNRTEDKVPGLGEIPVLGKLFGRETAQNDSREVVIVLTPSVVTENFRETKAQYPKDDERFNLANSSLFREQYRIRAEDLLDSQFIRGNRRLLAYRALANRVIERRPEAARKPPFAQFTGDRVPGEFVFVTGMMSRMLDRLKAADAIRIENLFFFEQAAQGLQRPVSLADLMARMGDGRRAESFFERNKGKALVLSFTLARNSMAAQDMFSEPVPAIELVPCEDRAAWSRLTWELNQPVAGRERYSIVINDASDLKRLQLAIATKNTVLNNGLEQNMLFNNWLPGRVINLQEVAVNWERTLEATVARYFFIGEHYYPYFMSLHQNAIRELDAALRQPEYAADLDGMVLPN
ncbi:MAG: type II and III secretion system protein [Burkholderiales bacterium]|nr:type II and III secretion system protein [Burkholderiales bacterium]